MPGDCVCVKTLLRIPAATLADERVRRSCESLVNHFCFNSARTRKDVIRTKSSDARRHGKGPKVDIQTFASDEDNDYSLTFSRLDARIYL